MLSRRSKKLVYISIPINQYIPPQNLNNPRGIRYPVDDKLLYENPSAYDLTPEALKVTI
jgi:hypothetical protein